MWQRIDKQNALSLIQYMAVGVGEDHGKPQARAFALELIKSGHVRNLFLECYQPKQVSFDTATAQNVGRADYQSVIIKEVNEAGPKPHDNRIELGKVALFAVSRKVPVHFLDTDTTKIGRAAMGKRDEEAAERFYGKTAGAGRVGSLVLYGSAHLKGGTETHGGWSCLGKLLDLPYVLFV
jgi:hypothetical protein